MSCSRASSAPRPSVGARALLLAVEAYKVLLSPLLGGHCRFYPSCSAYAEEALRLHGAVRGATLAGRRVLRCHPFSAGGFDPVPVPAAPRSSSSSRTASRS